MVTPAVGGDEDPAIAIGDVLAYLVAILDDDAGSSTGSAVPTSSPTGR